MPLPVAMFCLLCEQDLWYPFLPTGKWGTQITSKPVPTRGWSPVPNPGVSFCINSHSGQWAVVSHGYRRMHEAAIMVAGDTEQQSKMAIIFAFN